MKTLLKPFFFFLLGFAITGVVLTLSKCSKDDDLDPYAINPDELKQNIDLESINNTANEIEDACSASDQTAIDNLVLQESLDEYRDKEEPYTAEELAAIGNALKDRELTMATINFAEYAYTIDGKIYTLWMACDEEGVWKIIRY